MQRLAHASCDVFPIRQSVIVLWLEQEAMANLVPLSPRPCCPCPATTTPTNSLCAELLHQPSTVELGNTARESACNMMQDLWEQKQTAREHDLRAERDIRSQASPQRGVITHLNCEIVMLQNRFKTWNTRPSTIIESERTLSHSLLAHLTCNSMPVYNECIMPSVLQKLAYASLLTSAASMP